MKKSYVKDILQEAMFQLMSQKTIKKITVEEILECCDISRATFYRNFYDKYDLMHYCYKATVDTFIANIKQDNWKDILVEIFTFLRSHQQFFVNAFKSDGDNSFLTFLYDYSYKFYEDQLKSRTESKFLTQEEQDCIAFNCAGAVYLVELWINREMTETPAEMAERTYQFMPLQLQQFF